MHICTSLEVRGSRVHAPRASGVLEQMLFINQKLLTLEISSPNNHYVYQI